MTTINLDTHKAQRPQPKTKIELPPIVREYFDEFRGNPSRAYGVAVEYVDALWREATAFAKSNSVPCPVHEEEVQALRLLLERRRRAQ
jgi:hypothetical protein